MDPLSEFVDTLTAARIIGLAPQTLNTMRCRGGGPPFVKIHRRAVRYSVTDLRQWMRDRTRRSTSEPVRMAA
jgi:hypothetical protein